MENSNSTSDKVVFALSFLTLLVALSSYKNTLSQIIVTVFSYKFSVYDLLTYISIVLFFSVYVSAIDKLRDSNLGLQKIKTLEKCGLVADFLYLIAILALPGVFLISYFTSCFFSFGSYLLSIIAHLNFVPYPLISVINLINETVFSGVVISILNSVITGIILIMIERKTFK